MKDQKLVESYNTLRNDLNDLLLKCDSMKLELVEGEELWSAMRKFGKSLREKLNKEVK